MNGSPAPLVGRAAERARIAAALESIGARPGCIVSIEGEPGIGKSRLLADTVEAADGYEVLQARASEFERDVPYALFAEALDHDLPLGDRPRAHRALRELLEGLASDRPLLLCLDDVHWADPASLDALAALARRPPAAPVLIALAAREGQLPAPLPAALGAAARDGRLARLTLGPLAESEAAELIGRADPAVYRQAGGNPFYLEQLARGGGAASGGGIAADASIPSAVAAALSAELATLTPAARVMLDAAAISGDPFDADLAAAVAELEEPAALGALDDLVAFALVRPAAAPRQFAFRHPVVRHAVYEATGGGWRLGAHARAAQALERRGAGAVRRAHHVEHAAPPGDFGAIELLSEAAGELQAPAPATAAHFRAAALRLLPEAPEHELRRSRMQVLLSDAQAAAGDARAARKTLMAALATAAAGERLALTVALANQEWWLGGHEQARRRLHVALGDLPAQPSPDRIRLRLALALTALTACDLHEAQDHAGDALDDARAIGDPVFELAARGGGALAAVSEARPEAVQRLEDSSAALERLSHAQLTTRLPALWMHGRARRGLGRFDTALADLERGAAIAADTGRERILLVTRLESVPVLIELGRLADATAAAAEGVELARLSANPRMLLWALCGQSSARLAAGDVGAAEAALAAGEAAAARCGTPWAVAVTGVARAHVLLARNRPREAVAAAAAAHAAAAGAPLTRARARLAEGRALAALERDAAVAALRDAERAFDGFGALRLRDQTVRELRRLGHRVRRPARDPAAGPLTAREAEIAGLIAAGRTNREVAEQLVLSTRTIEAHLRNIYAKLGVRSRVELTRAVERGGLD